MSHLGECRAYFLVQEPIQWLQLWDIRKNLVHLVLRDAHSKTAVLEDLGREPFVLSVHNKHDMHLKGRNKISAVDIHWGLVKLCRNTET